MTYEMVNFIAESWFDVFGGTMIFPFIIIGTVALILLLSGANKYAFFMVLLPLITTILVYGVGSGLLAGLTTNSTGIIVVLFMILGLFVAYAFWSMMKN